MSLLKSVFENTGTGITLTENLLRAFLDTYSPFFGFECGKRNLKSSTPYYSGTGTQCSSLFCGLL